MKKKLLTKLIKNSSLLTLSVVGILGLTSVNNIAQAQLAPVVGGVLDYTSSDGYVTSPTGKVVKTKDDLCVRTGSYDAGKTSHPDCNVTKMPVVKAERVILPTTSPEYIAESARIYFNFDSEFLPYHAKQALDTFLDNAPKGALLRVEAAADFLGSASYNQLLSERRAQAITNYLLQKENVRVGAVVGLGEKEAKLRKKCKQTNRGELISCVAEDRFGLVTIQSLDK